MAAVVGFPDDRLGERCCAFVTLRAGAGFTLDELKDYMGSRKVAKHYWPERLEIVPAMPMTASGKIQKFQLRQQAKAFAGA
jgi:cyclohexanecarboxylate-CoA ligase